MKWTTVAHTLLFSGLGLFSYFLIANYTDFSPLTAEVLYSWEALTFTILAFNLVGYSTLRLSEWVNKLYTVNAFGKWQTTMLYIALGLLFLLLNYGLFVTAKILANASPIFNFSRSGWNLLIVVWLVEMVVIGLLLSNQTMKANWLLQQEATKLQMENTQAKYTALQNQLNPHFLFNSLNTLIAEIKYNPDNAMRFTRHLSSVYRYVLQCQGRNLVALDEELDFMNSYLFLHEVRLGNCINCKCQIPPGYSECQIPPLTLQLLVENVIKHNSISQTKPMDINITIDDGYVVMSNPICPKKKKETSQGIGLKNLANRYQLIADKNIIIQKTDSTFTIKIPII